MDRPTRVNYREKMMQPDRRLFLQTAKQFASAFAPFPRYTWIHPHVPNDSFDRVCKIIWERAKEAEEELGRGQSSPERPQDKDSTALDHKPNHRSEEAEEQQKEADDSGPSARCEEEEQQQHHTDFILPCPYPSGRTHPQVAEPAQVLNLVMEEETRGNEEQEEDAGDEQSCESTESSAPEPEPLVTNPVCSATEHHAPHLQDEEAPPLPSKPRRDRCESEDEKNTSGSSTFDCSSSDDDDDDRVSLPGVRRCATDSSDGDSESENNHCEQEEEEIQHSSVELSSDTDSSSSEENDFPPLSTTGAGIRPRPTEPAASGKMHGQWEIPLSFHPHDIPTATLAHSVAAHAQAPVQGKAEAPRANWRHDAPSAGPAQQEAYDLLADFPALRPPKNPLVALGMPRDAHRANRRQESGASHQRRTENVPHEVSSICAGDQRAVLDLQTFGSTMSPTTSCEEPRANNQPPPRVAGADGADVNARSWASTAKEGMKQAAAPQEKARPCSFQPIVTINRAKAPCSAPQNLVLPSHRTAAPVHHGPRPRTPNRFVHPGLPPVHQHSGAREYRANCPAGLRCPRFPLQQARGKPPKHSHV